MRGSGGSTEKTNVVSSRKTKQHLVSFDNSVLPEQVIFSLKENNVKEVRLWVDDDLVDRKAPEGWIHVTTAYQAKAIIENFSVVEMSLDNDLGDDEIYGQGKHVVDFLCEKQIVEEKDLWPENGITLHTANSTARDQMQRAVLAYASKIRKVNVSITKSGKRKLDFK